MQLIQSGNVKNLVLQLSIYLLTVLSFMSMIAGSIYGIPYEDATERAESEDDWSSYPPCNSPGLNLSEECSCSIQFLPSSWGVLMHGFVYIFMTLTTVYLAANTLRSGREGNLFLSPPVFSVYAAVAATISFIFYFSWIFAWNNGDWTGGTVVICFATVSCWISTVLFSVSLSSHTEELNHYMPVDRWIYVILVQNTLATVSTWFLCLFLINFAMTLVYGGSVAEPKASEVMIIILTFIIAIWVPVDVMLCDKIFRYMISPLVVLMWTLSSIFDRLDGDSCHDATVRVYAVALLTIVIFILVGRSLLMVYRHIRKPLANSQ